MEVEITISLGEVTEIYRVAHEGARYLVGEPEYTDLQRFFIEPEGLYEAVDGWDKRLFGAAMCAEGMSLWHLNTGSAKGRWEKNSDEVTVSYKITLHDAGTGNIVQYSCGGSATADMDPKTLYGASLVAYGISKLIEGREDYSEGMFEAGLEAEPCFVMRPPEDVHGFEPT